MRTISFPSLLWFPLFPLPLSESSVTGSICLTRSFRRVANMETLCCRSCPYKKTEIGGDYPV